MTMTANVKSDRVGTFFYTEDFDKVKEGETVQFEYEKGNKSDTRTVFVMKVDRDAIEGLTLERNQEYRRYLVDKITSNIYIVKPFVEQNSTKRVRFDEAGTALLASLTGEQLAELYGKYVAVEGDGTEYDPNTGEVVVKLPEPKATFVVNVNAVNDDIGPALTIYNKNQEEFLVFLYEDGTVGISVTDILDDANVTPEKFLSELTKFLS